MSISTAVTIHMYTHTHTCFFVVLLVSLRTPSPALTRQAAPEPRSQLAGGVGLRLKKALNSQSPVSGFLAIQGRGFFRGAREAGTHQSHSRSNSRLWQSLVCEPEVAEAAEDGVLEPLVQTNTIQALTQVDRCDIKSQITRASQTWGNMSVS